MADNDTHVSKPLLEPDLYVLCVDGTLASDSVAFFNYLHKAGMRIKKPADRVSVGNLLSLVGKDPSGTIDGPSGQGSVFPFDADALKHLPIKKEPLPGGGQRIAEVLLPQGEVKGHETDFSDPMLGSSPLARIEAARRNSELLKRLCIAPGVTDGGTPSGHLDFATAGNTSTDILYLSGHGSMAGTVCGEAGTRTGNAGYMNYFELLLLLKPELQTLAAADLVPPLWLVIGACFSMRPSAAEVWLRLFNAQRVPLRGILGYQTTSPLADVSAEINRQFALALGDGLTFIEAWRKANNANEKWTALAFDYAEHDTLTSLRDLKRSGAASTAPPPEERKLFFHEQGRRTQVRIEPPQALLELYRWDTSFQLIGEPSEPKSGYWDKLLVTNFDFDEASFKAAAAASDGKLVSNGSWTACGARSRLIDIGAWDHWFCPGNIHAIVVFPPFTAPFENDWQPGDQLELGVVHVRQTYPKTVAFLDLFEVYQINGLDKDKVAFEIPAPDGARDVQSGKTRNRIRFPCPTGGLPFQPARVTVRYKKEAASHQYLWFWFSVKVLRGGKQIFYREFDNFIVQPGSHGCSPPAADDPLPNGDGWTLRPDSDKSTP